MVCMNNNMHNCLRVSFHLQLQVQGRRKMVLLYFLASFFLGGGYCMLAVIQAEKKSTKVKGAPAPEAHLLPTPMKYNNGITY